SSAGTIGQDGYVSRDEFCSGASRICRLRGGSIDKHRCGLVLPFPPFLCGEVYLAGPGFVLLDLGLRYGCLKSPTLHGAKPRVRCHGEFFGAIAQVGQFWGIPSFSVVVGRGSGGFGLGRALLSGPWAVLTLGFPFLTGDF
ncbi:hypothetical protein U1Q18_015382, partial [Sarracenia purpurea var. burkii]